MRAVTATILLVLTGWCRGQTAQLSPCPDVLKYEPTGEQGRWYGVISLSTNSTIHPLLLNIVLDRKAELFGSWTGDVTTLDNKAFKIEHIKIKDCLGPATDIRFYVKYNPDLKIPRVTEIRLNEREICKTKIPQLPSDKLIFDSNVMTTVESIAREKRDVTWTKYIRSEKTQSSSSNIDPKNWLTFISGQQSASPSTRPVMSASVYESQPNPNNWLTFITGSQSVRPRPQPEQLKPLPESSRPQPVRPSSPLEKPASKPNYAVDTRFDDNDKVECGKVIKKSNPLVVGGKQTLEGQWPWQVALYRTEHVNNKFFCGGTLLSRQHVVTAAYCVALENKNTLSVYLGKHNLQTSTQGVQIRFVSEVIVHPQYNASSLTQNLAILKLLGSVQFSEFVRPVCLWPENQADLSFVIGKTGFVVGWGFDITGMATEELVLVEMPVVSQETCIRSYSQFFGKVTSDTTYCAGYRNGSSTCNGDAGGGMVMFMRGSWYLRGLVSLSVALKNNVCDPSHYVVFVDLAKFVMWIKENIR